MDAPTKNVSADLGADSSILDSLLQYLLSGGEPAPIIWFTLIIFALTGAFRYWLKFKSICLALEYDQAYRMKTIESGIPYVGGSLTASVAQTNKGVISMPRLFGKSEITDFPRHLDAAE